MEHVHHVLAGLQSPKGDGFLVDRIGYRHAVEHHAIGKKSTIIAIQMHQCRIAIVVPKNIATRAFNDGIHVIRMTIRPANRDQDFGLWIRLAVLAGVLHQEQRGDEHQGKAQQNIEQHIGEGVLGSRLSLDPMSHPNPGERPRRP